MSYAQVIDGTITVEQGRLPNSARRLDTQEWVMGLATAPVELQQATGWYEVDPTDRPADTPTHTHDRSLTLVNGVPTETWTQRAKTQAELTADTESSNLSAIQTNLAQDQTAMQAIIDATNATINSNPATHIKAIARNLRRLNRKALNDLSGSS